ncbi:MAG: hypothetical protein WCJ01_08735, partial [Ignavibacteria bacterium]
MANTVNDGTETVTVPASPSGTCRIKVESAANANVYGINPGNFTIAAAPSLIITSPNGGENWQTGSSHNITWSGSNVTNVKIEYSTDNGAGWATIITNTPAGAGSYGWTVPNLPSVQCRVKVSDAGNASLNSVSANTFTISAIPIPSITTTAPLTGANWTAGTQQTVRWTSSNVSGNVNIKLSLDGGAAYPVTLAANTVNDGTETVTVPDNPSGTCR